MISFVIPLRDEFESLATLHSELASVVAASSLGSVELVFVDDGSRDGSWPEIERLAELDERVRGLRFRRNFGKAAALSAGFHAAQGEYVFTLDADLQDDPAEVPRFLDLLQTHDLDVVSGWKRRRHDPWHKVGPSRVFNTLVSRVTGCRLHDHNCGYKLYRRAVLDEVSVYGELHRFIPALAHARGFRIGEIEVHHRARRHGRSKYGMSRFLKGLLDLVTVSFLTRYGRRPLHAFGVVAIALGLLGTLGLIALAFVPTPPIAAVVLAALAVASAVGLVGIGLVAELTVASRIDVGSTYSVAATAGNARAALDAGDLAS